MLRSSEVLSHPAISPPVGRKSKFDCVKSKFDSVSIDSYFFIVFKITRQFLLYPINCMLSSSMSSSSEIVRMEISQVPYAWVMSSLIYVMICIIPNITQIMGVVSRIMENLGEDTSVGKCFCYGYFDHLASV